VKAHQHPQQEVPPTKPAAAASTWFVCCHHTTMAVNMLCVEQGCWVYFSCNITAVVGVTFSCWLYCKAGLQWGGSTKPGLVMHSEVVTWILDHTALRHIPYQSVES